MRYLAQLTRETKARVAPSRQPSWLRPMGTLIHETLSSPITQPAVSAAAPPPMLREAAATPLKSSMKDLSAVVHNNRAPGNPKALAEPTVATISSKASRIATLELSPTRHEPAVLENHSTQTEHSPELESLEPLNAPQAKHSEVAAIRKPAAPPTLQSIIAEIARRQQELDQRYKDDQASRALRPASGSSGITEKVSAKESDGKEDVRLNIGSILVQVESEPAPHANAQSQPAQRRLPPSPRGASSDRWARSFLDR